MKFLKTMTAVLTVGLLFGFGLVMLNPVGVSAGPNPCNNFCGYSIHCEIDASCNPSMERMHVICYKWADLVFCEGPWTCGCHDIGCGDLCEPE